jgi:Glutamine amidotransferases class-II
MGVLPIPEKDIIKKWRLQPGKMLLVDLDEGRLIPDEEHLTPTGGPLARTRMHAREKSLRNLFWRTYTG